MFSSCYLYSVRDTTRTIRFIIYGSQEDEQEKIQKYANSQASKVCKKSSTYTSCIDNCFCFLSTEFWNISFLFSKFWWRKQHNITTLFLFRQIYLVFMPQRFLFDPIGELQNLCVVYSARLFTMQCMYIHHTVGLTSYFWALRSFQMFTGPFFQIKLHLLSAKIKLHLLGAVLVDFKDPPEIWNPLSKAVQCTW